MWGHNLLLAGIGLSAGCIVAGGICSFIIGLGVISDLADRTHSAEHILLYENSVALGAMVGTILWVYQIPIPIGRWLAACFGIFSGLFVGCWAMALAEMLNVFPIFVKRIQSEKLIPYAILGIALGKGFGALLFFIKRW